MVLPNIFFNNSEFKRVYSVPTQEQIKGYLLDGNSLFIIIETKKCRIYYDKKIILTAPDINAVINNVMDHPASLLGYLNSKPLFLISFDDISNDLLVNINDIEFDSELYEQSILAGYLMQNFHIEVKFCQKCGYPLNYSDATNTTLKCSECNIKFRPIISPCVIFTIWAETKQLLGLRAKELYSCLSGFIEIAETSKQAALREFEEETQLDSEAIKSIKCLQMDNPRCNEYGEESYMISYSIELTSVRPINGNKEVKDFKWVSLEDWNSARERTDSGDYSEWVIPRMGTTARWIQELTWKSMGVTKEDEK